MTDRLISFSLVFSLLVSTAPSAAQDTLTTLVGRVVDADTGEPVALAITEVVGADRQVVTDTDGFFRIPRINARNASLLIRRVGYAPILMTINLEPDPTTGVTNITTLDDPIPLRPLPVALEDIVVVSDPWIARTFYNKVFYHRSRLIGREDIEKRPYHMDGLLRRAVGAPTFECGFDYYIDGVRVPPHLASDLVLRRQPIEFDAVEVYYSVNRMGSRLRGRDLPGVPCGVIRLWSHVGAVTAPQMPTLVINREASQQLPAGMGEVRGRLVDDRGEPVSGIVMSLHDSTGVEIVRATSDDEGRYTLHAAPGSYQLMSMRPGYFPWISAVFALVEGQILDFTHPGR